MLFVGEGEYVLDIGFVVGVGEYFGFFVGDCYCGFYYFCWIVYDVLQVVFGEYYQVYVGQVLFYVDDYVGDFLGVVQDFCCGVQVWYFVVDYCYFDGVVVVGNIVVMYGYYFLLLFFWDEKRFFWVILGEFICFVCMCQVWFCDIDVDVYDLMVLFISFVEKIC